MDDKPDCSSEKIKIKEEKICYNEDYNSEDAFDQIDIKDGLIKLELTHELELRDNVDPGHFKFVTPEDLKGEDTVESYIIESTTNPTGIEEGMYIITT